MHCWSDWSAGVKFLLSVSTFSRQHQGVYCRNVAQYSWNPLKELPTQLLWFLRPWEPFAGTWPLFLQFSFPLWPRHVACPLSEFSSCKSERSAGEGVPRIIIIRAVVGILSPYGKCANARISQGLNKQAWGWFYSSGFLLVLMFQHTMRSGPS